MKTALSVIRIRCNYSQAMLAEVIGVSRQMVCAWENGNKKLPNNRVAELAALFGVPSDILKENNLQKVEQWCDRPLFSNERNGRQVFSFEPVERADSLNLFLSHPGDAMLSARSRELMLKRNNLLQSMSNLVEVRADQQAKDLNYAELCVSILEKVQTLVECAVQMEGSARERMLHFVQEQLLLLERIFTGEKVEQGEQTDWQKQQTQLLRTHWAQLNRTYRAKEEQVPIRIQEDGKIHRGLTERLNRLYHCAMEQGISRRDLQIYLERIMREEYDDERQNRAAQ